MHTIARILGAITILLILAGCSESAALFASLEDTPEVQVRTVATGSFLAPGATFSIQLDYGDDEFQALTEVTLEMYDAGMALVHTDAIEGSDLENDLVATFDIPDLPQGPYRIVITGYRGQEIVLTEERTVFILDPMPAISAIAIHPSTPAPGATALAIVELAIGDELVPYLRWRFADSIITEGYLRDGTDQVQLALPEEPGVYGVDVEFYPWGPEEGVDVTEVSVITQSVDVFVGEAAAAAAPEDLIIAWEFDGTTDAIGALATVGDDSDALSGSDRSYTLLHGVFGILVDAGIPLRVPFSIVPAHTGAVMTELSLMLGEGQQNILFAMDSPSLSLEAERTLDTRGLTIRASTAVASIEGEIALVAEDSVDDLEITVLRTAEELVLFFDQGADGEGLEIAIPIPPAQSGGSEVQEDALLLEPGVLTFEGDGVSPGMINRLAIRAASPETMARLLLIRELSRRDDRESLRIVSIDVAAGVVESDTLGAEGEAIPTVRTVYLAPASPVALSLEPGIGRAQILDDPYTAIIRDASGYRLFVGDQSVPLGDEPVILFELLEQEGDLVFRSFADSSVVPLGTFVDTIPTEISEGAIAQLEPVEDQ